MGPEGLKKKTPDKVPAGIPFFEGLIDIKTATQKRLEDYLVYLNGRHVMLRIADKEEDAENDRLIEEVKDELRTRFGLED